MVSATYQLGGSPISARQHQIVQLIAEGMSNKQIANNLGIAKETVRLHVSQTLKATKLPNRTALAVEYVKDVYAK